MSEAEVLQAVVGGDPRIGLPRSGAAELHELCEWAIREARSGEELAAVAALVVGADLWPVFGVALEDRIFERVRAIHATWEPREALRHARGIGEALCMLTRHQLDEPAADGG